jgi:hypothetical protein
MGMRSVITKIESLNPETYAGFAGELWLDNISGKLHVGSGATPGGNIAVTTDATGNITLSPGSTINFSDGSNALTGGGGSGSSLINGSYSVTLESNGNLMLPGGVAQIAVESDGGVRIGDAPLNTAPNTQIKIGGANNAFEIFGGPPGYSWTFGSDGSLGFPGNVYIEDNIEGTGLFGIGAPEGFTVLTGAGAGEQWTFGAAGNLPLPDAGTVTNNGNTWTFGMDGGLTFPSGAGFTKGASGTLKTNDGTTQALDFRDAAGGGFFTDGSGFTLRANGSKNWQFGTSGILTLPSNNYLETTDGNLKVGSQGVVTIRSNAATVGSTKSWTFGSDGTLTIPGEINSAAGSGNVVINASNGVVRTWTFDGDGALEFPDSTQQTTAYKRTTGSWTVATGSASYSFTVPGNATYVMWVRGNIANGIIVWNATATVTNSNVPVIGQQYAWNYTGGGTPIEITAIPDQFIGTANAIVSSTPLVGNTSNVFDFTINNTSGAAQTVYWGYVTQ